MFVINFLLNHSLSIGHNYCNGYLQYVATHKYGNVTYDRDHGIYVKKGVEMVTSWNYGIMVIQEGEFCPFHTCMDLPLR